MKCRDNNQCDGPDSVTLKQQVMDDEEYIEQLIGKLEEEEEEIR